MKSQDLPFFRSTPAPWITTSSDGFAIDGDSIRLLFRKPGGDLVSKSGANLSGFTAAGADRQFHPAIARIDGATVVVNAPGIDYPVSVRYAWINVPAVSLYNADGLPAAAFRTDDW